MSNKFFCGIDIGSSATKVVLLDSRGQYIDSEAIQKGVGRNLVDKILQDLYNRNNLSSEQCGGSIATGYGRIRYKSADEQISEISCHAKGVTHMVSEVGTVIDIGGQDLKAMKLGKNGIIEEFMMNDKCAAGTGRFLEVMSHVLGVDVDALGDIDAAAEREIQISNTCTVFAESEVISYLSEDEKIENIVAGIHASVARKAASLVKRIGVNDKVVLTGGVARNQGVVRALRKELEREIFVPENAQLTGALGAALFAYERDSE